LQKQDHAKIDSYTTSVDVAAPDVEVRLREQIAKLKKTVANKNKELSQIKEDVPALVRAVSLLTAENAELRDLLEMPAANVGPLRPDEH
ncbi:hypothetical protein ACFFRZ_11220, partial [Nonomuraea rubra]